MEQQRNWGDCEHFIEVQRRKLKERSAGALGHSLISPMPGESQEQLQHMLDEDVRRAQEGLVALLYEDGELRYKHIDDLFPEDRLAVQKAEIARVAWLSGRAREKGYRLGVPPPSPRKPRGSSSCPPHRPAISVSVPGGGYEMQCLKCGHRGPKRATSADALEALDEEATLRFRE